ncbi:MAG: RNA-binding cell elongation regulator Jag/EloR [Clostridia bacterium]|jgi:spoIIIJ-associated protein|nr:KH domain-containing protein [Clostridia bacterium]
MKFVEVSEKNIERAIKKGLEELNTTLENVDIKVLNEGGLFSKAKVRITLITDENEFEEKEKAEILSKIEAKATILNGKPPILKRALLKSEKPKKQEKTQKNTENLVKNDDFSKNIECECAECEKIDHKENVEKALKFLNGLISILNIKADVITEKQQENVVIKINGEQTGDLIGYRGESLAALQFLINNLTRREEGSRILVDIENYRERREDTLKNLAVRLAHKSAKTGKIVKLEPMNAYERKIIHTALQSDTFVKTISRGEEPNRYLIIIPNKQVDGELVE